MTRSQNRAENVWIVDDDRSIRWVLEKALSQAGMDIECFEDGESLLRQLPDGLVATCTWGNQGAWAVAADGQLLHAPAPQLPKIVDTLGAGDVFNAAMVFELGTGKPLGQALPAAVGLASLQCTRPGLALVVEQP